MLYAGLPLAGKGNNTVLRALLVCTFCFAVSVVTQAKAANDAQEFKTARYTLYVGSERSKTSSQKVSIPEEIVAGTISALNNIQDELERVFIFSPEKRVVLRLLSQEEFHRRTGAPRWTSAMYYRGEITIPAAKKDVVLDDIQRAVRHEYVHAFIAEMTDGRCPAWLDEGIAQIIEGKPNPLLGPSLRQWISSNDAMPLRWLNNGFTTLDANIVPAAYAQSLFATRTLINSYGFKAIRRYLEELKKGTCHEVAFEIAFDMKVAAFEQRLTEQMRRWASSNAVHP